MNIFFVWLLSYKWEKHVKDLGESSLHLYQYLVKSFKHINVPVCKYSVHVFIFCVILLLSVDSVVYSTRYIKSKEKKFSSIRHHLWLQTSLSIPERFQSQLLKQSHACISRMIVAQVQLFKTWGSGAQSFCQQRATFFCDHTSWQAADTWHTHREVWCSWLPFFFFKWSNI